MTLEQAITWLAKKYGVPRGLTAMPNHRYYRQAEGATFVPCECSRRDAGFVGPNNESDYFDFIGRTDGNAVIYVGAFRKITVGPKGYHFKRNRPCLPKQ